MACIKLARSLRARNSFLAKAKPTVEHGRGDSHIIEDISTIRFDPLLAPSSEETLPLTAIEDHKPRIEICLPRLPVPGRRA